MAKRTDLAAALADTAGSTRRRPPPPEPPPVQADTGPYTQPSRRGGQTAPITAHMPRDVRKQLKTAAAERDRKMGDILAEALNLWFEKEGLPPIARLPRADA